MGQVPARLIVLFLQLSSDDFLLFDGWSPAGASWSVFRHEYISTNVLRRQVIRAGKGVFQFGSEFGNSPRQRASGQAGSAQNLLERPENASSVRPEGFWEICPRTEMHSLQVLV